MRLTLLVHLLARFGFVLNEPGRGVVLNSRTENDGGEIVRIPYALYPSGEYRLQVSTSEALHLLCNASSQVLPDHALSGNFSIGAPPARDTFQWIWPPQDLSTADVVSLGGTYTILGAPLQNSTTHALRLRAGKWPRAILHLLALPLNGSILEKSSPQVCF
eukprot:m.1206032 g.1206032  ORF g.1206032 m.1206032 type:complete len:161 (+) comp24585_c1_seq21:588-1070(+)